MEKNGGENPFLKLGLTSKPLLALLVPGTGSLLLLVVALNFVYNNFSLFRNLYLH